MRDTTKHVLLVALTLLALALAADAATAAEVGTQQAYDCYTSSGGAMTICY